MATVETTIRRVRSHFPTKTECENGFDDSARTVIARKANNRINATCNTIRGVLAGHNNGDVVTKEMDSICFGPQEHRRNQLFDKICIDGGFDEVEAIHVLTQGTRANLIQDILGHPTEMPSLKELDHMNPSKSTATIRNHLDKLITAKIVKRVELPKEERSRDLPHTFYTLTKEGWELLEDHSIFIEEKDRLKEEYRQVKKPDDVQRYEDAPRPFILNK